MKKKISLLRKFILPLAAAVALAGCLGGALEPKPDPTAFYRLSAKDKLVSAGEVKGGICATIMPVVLPPYMERTQIVTSDGNTRVDVSEFNRWIELPSMSFGRVLMENISANAKDSNISVYPSVAFSEDAVWIKVSVFECIGTIGGELSFKANWQIISSDNKGEISSKDFIKSYPVKGGFDSYVEAINEACADLSRQIAAELNKLSKKS